MVNSWSGSTIRLLERKGSGFARSRKSPCRRGYCGQSLPNLCVYQGGSQAYGGVGKAHKGADPPEPPAPKPTKPAAVIQETPIPTTSKQAIPETTTTPAKKPPTKIQQAMEKASEERVSAYEAKEALKQDVEALRKAAKPTTGGAGSKKRGAVVDPSDTIGGIIDAARSMGVTKKVSAASEIGVSLFGNTLDRLKSLGASGREIAHDLSAIFDDAAKHTATYGFRLKETTRATFGKLYGISRSARTSLGIRGNGLDIVSKVESGKALSKSESRLWKEWVSIVKAVKANAKKFGVGVMDRVGSHPEGKQLIGTEVRWAADGKIKSGVVIATDANSITVQVGRGKDTVSLPSGLSFVREQLVDPDKFFPRVLRADVRSNLFREGSQVRSEAIGHLKKNGFANTDDEAAEIIREAFGQGVVEIHSPIASRLRRQRTGGLLPDSFYDRDFLSVAEKYIAQASMDIAAAKRWGKDYTLLTEKLAALPHGAKEAKDLSTQPSAQGRYSIHRRIGLRLPRECTKQSPS